MKRLGGGVRHCRDGAEFKVVWTPNQKRNEGKSVQDIMELKEDADKNKNEETEEKNNGLCERMSERRSFGLRVLNRSRLNSQI